MQILDQLQVLGVNVDINRDDVFNSFLKKFESQQVLEEYVSTSPKLMAYFKDKRGDAMELRRIIVAMSGNMKAVNNNVVKKDNSLPYSAWTLSFTGPNPLEAQSILNNYIEFVAATVVTQSLLNIRDAVVLKVQTEKDALELDRAKLANIQESKIKRLYYALQVAKAAGIIQPVRSNAQTINDDPDFSVSLGARGIERKLEIEKSITDVTELVPEWRNRQYQLSVLEKVNVSDIAFPVFKYQQSASLPVKKYGPGIEIIVALFALMGGVLSSSWALFSEAWTQLTSKIQPPKAN